MSFLLSAFVGLSLSAHAFPEPLIKLDAPAAIKGSLVAIRRPLGFAGECAELHPELDLFAEFEKLEKRYMDATLEVEGVWPDIDSVEIEQAATEAGQPWPSCRRGNVRSALKQAGKALDAHSLMFRQLTATMHLRGAWVGPLHLCRDNVESVKLISDDLRGQPALQVKLAPPLRASWSKITGHAVGHALHIRLDGAVIAKPIVHEPIEIGEFQVAGPQREILTRLAERTGERC